MDENNVELVEVNGLQFYVDIEPSTCADATHYDVYYKETMNYFFSNVVIGDYDENDIFYIIANDIKDVLEH